MKQPSNTMLEFDSVALNQKINTTDFFSHTFVDLQHIPIDVLLLSCGQEILTTNTTDLISQLYCLGTTSNL
jgi:hypothetical protein